MTNVFDTFPLNNYKAYETR